jgi:iron complex outermembrane receptor protein
MKNGRTRYLAVLLGLMPVLTQAQSDDAVIDRLFAEEPAPTPEAEAAPTAEPAQAAAEDAESQLPHEESPSLATIPVDPLDPTEQDPPQQIDEAEAGTAQLDDIVVTVTKRAQASRDIPSSMTVIGGEKLEQLGLRKLKDIFTLVPGINMQDEIAGLQRKVSVRGVGPDDGTNQTVGSVMGDIPISDPYGATTIIDPNPWDMRTVEVLKGPQGTLFGANSLAGLIRYVPNNPELDRWSGKAFYDFSSVKMGGTASAFGAALNVPFGDRVAVRASGIFQQLPGVLDSDNPARQEKDIDTGESWNGRLMVLWQPTDRLTINAWHTSDERNTDDINIVTFTDGSYTREDAPAASPAKNTYDLSTLDIRYRFDWATLVSLSGYQEKTSYNLVETSYLVQPLARAGLSYARTQRDVKTDGILQELRLVSPDDGDALSWVAGVYFSTYSADIRSQLYVPNTQFLSQLLGLVEILPLDVLQGLISEQGLTATQTGFDPLEADERAIYGEANYDFSDRLRLTLGSRLYQTKVEGTLRASGASGANDGAAPSQREEGWSPKVALTWRPWTDVMFYGTVSRGFQFGGFNVPTVATPNVPLTFDSSSLWNYEAGVRTDWFDRTLRADLTVFFLDWTNPQVSQRDPLGINGWVDNVGSSDNIGLESTLRWITPLDGVTIEQATSYIDARTAEAFTDSSGVEVPEGTVMPSSPRVQSVTTLSYTRPFGDFMTQTSLINSYKSQSWAEITHITEIEAHSLLSFTFNVSYSRPSWTPSLTFSVNNILDVQQPVAGFGPAGGTGPIDNVVARSTYAYTLPRSFVVRLSAEF